MAFEIFGGRTSLRHFVVTGADDDTIDADTGWQGTIQYVIGVQKTSGAADSMIELDSANALEAQTPRTHLKLANFTLHQPGFQLQRRAMLLRGGADATPRERRGDGASMACLRFNSRANILAAADANLDKVGPPVFRSVVMQCSGTPFVGTGGVTPALVQSTFLAGGASNSFTFTPGLTGRLHQRCG